MEEIYTSHDNSKYACVSCNLVESHKATSNMVVSPFTMHMHFLVPHPKLLSLNLMENGRAPAIKLAGIV